MEVIQQILGENEVERLLANEQAASKELPPEGTDEGAGATTVVEEAEQESCVIIDLQTYEADCREVPQDDVICLSASEENPL